MRFFRKRTNPTREECIDLAGSLDEVFDDVTRVLRVGATSEELNTTAEVAIRTRGLASLYYSRRFPHYVSVSVDNQVATTPPSNARFQHGQLVTVSVGIKRDHIALYRSWTYALGSVCKDDARLLNGSHQALMDAVAATNSGATIRDISAAIAATLAKSDLAACRKFQGHAITCKPYGGASIPQFVTQQSKEMDLKLRSDQVLSLAVLATTGSWDTVDTASGTVTRDGSKSVQFIHLVAVDPDGCTVLTKDRTLQR